MVIDSVSGTPIQVLESGDLSLVRTIATPGTSTSLIGLSFLTAPVTVQDAVRGDIAVPAGSLVVVNGSDTPDRLYYLDPTGSGTILADVALGGPTPVDVAGAVAVTYHASRGTLFVLRYGRDLVTEIDPATGAALQSFHSGFAVDSSYVTSGLAVHPTRYTLVLGGSSRRLVELDPDSGRVIGTYDPVDNVQLGTIDLRQQGIWFESTAFGDIKGLAFDNSGVLMAGLYGGRIVELDLPGDPTALLLADGSEALALDGTPADPTEYSANVNQSIRVVGSGYNRFTEVEFERVTVAGARGFIRVRADAVSADGTIIEVVVPDEAVSGSVRVSGAPGPGLFLQITPTIRRALPDDGYPSVNFDNPVEGFDWYLFGSGLVEGDMRVTFGGILIDDNSVSTLVNTVNGSFRSNGRLGLTVPERALAGPVKVETAGGWFQVDTIPIASQAAVGLDSIEATALSGTPVDVSTPSANTGQWITLHGYGFSSSSNIIFTAVAEDGTRGQIVARPTTVVSISEMTVRVPALAVTGPVTVSGSGTSVPLQIVPTLDGISIGSLVGGSSIRLSGSGIPEGGGGFGEDVVYDFGGSVVSDTDGVTGPDVFSALDVTLEIDLNVPVDATGSVVTVTTAGGTARLELTDVVISTVGAEDQGEGVLDDVGGTLTAASALTMDPSSLLTVTGRINVNEDVDLYRLVGAEAGGILSVSATGAQSPYQRFRLFDDTGAELSGVVSSFSQFVLPAGDDYYLGYTCYPNYSYNVVDGSGTSAGYFVGDYTLTLRYADPDVTSLDGIVATATRGIPADSNLASASVGQTITIEGEGFDDTTRVRFVSFSSWYPQRLLDEVEVAPTSVAGDGTSLEVVVPIDAVTGSVRLTDERGGLILQIVPTVDDLDIAHTHYSDGARMELTGSGFTEGAQTLILGSAIGSGGAVEVKDLWDFAGPVSFYHYVDGQYVENARVNFTLPADPPSGPVKIQTLGGSSAAFPITLTGISAGTTAERGTPTDAALPSANVREAITLEGSGFDHTTEVVFPIQPSNWDLPGTVIVNPSQVSADGTSLQAIVPDQAVTGDIRIVGAEDGVTLQIVPTIVQVLTPASYATGQTLNIQGSGFIENDVIVTLGSTLLLDTGAFIGPEVNNPNIPLAGKDRADNDGISLQVPPNATDGPYVVRTTGGSAKFGVIIDLGIVIQEERIDRTVAPGEQELVRAEASVDGWFDFDVTFTSSTADLIVLDVDGTPAALVEFTDTGADVHTRVAINQGDIVFLQVNGLSLPVSYDVVAINHDRFDDPVGFESGNFSGDYGADPDGRNDTPDAATDFEPASYVFEGGLSITPNDVDWFTWIAQADGEMGIGALFANATGELGFRIYADSDDDGVLSVAEQAAPTGTGVPSPDGARLEGIPAGFGQRFWVEVFGIDGDSDGATDKNVYTMTFSNVDLIDAGLLLTHPAPDNDTQANAVDLGGAVSWSSLTLTDVLTIHEPDDQDWFRFNTLVPGTLDVLVDFVHPEVGQVNAQVIDAASGAGLTLLEFEDLGERLRFSFAPVAKGQELLVQFAGQPNAYTFSIQNHDLLEPNPSMAEPANLGLVVHRRIVDVSLPGLPDAGLRDNDWFKFATAAPDGRLDVTATSDSVTGGDVTVMIWADSNDNQIPEASLGELLAEGTSIGGAPVTVSSPAGEFETLFVQVFDPSSGPFTGIVYSLELSDVDRFDKADPSGAANDTSATATDLGAVVHAVESGLTSLPFDEDWFAVTTRAQDGTLDVLVSAQGDPVIVNVFEDSDDDGSPDVLLNTGDGSDIHLLGIPALKDQKFWVQVVLEDATDLDSQGSLVDLEIVNRDRFDDPLGDGFGGLVGNPSGYDPDGPNDGPRTSGDIIEGTLRLVQPDPAIAATIQGHVGVSTDGLGTFTTGNLQAEIPAGSTIEFAFLYVATRSRFGQYRPAAINFEGTDVDLEYLPNVDNGTAVNFETASADVTAVVAAAVGSDGGVFDFTIDETAANAGLGAGGSDEHLDEGIEGTALVVIYSNPMLPVRTIAVLEGGLTGPAVQTTRFVLSTPVDTTDPDFIAELSLGISFGYQDDGQFSTVNVDGSRMTSAAGNFDDGQGDDGALITVGGVGDSSANPADPFNSLDTTDDELYNLAPFISDGDIEIVLDTANPSDDDSIFLAVITLSGEAGVAALNTDLGIVGEATENDLTLSMGDQDWFRIEAGEAGDLAGTIDFEPDGSALALFFRDSDDDGLPNDLNGDGVFDISDTVGDVAYGENQILISNVPDILVGDVFLLRVYNPTGQLEYDLDIRINQAPVAVDDNYIVAEGGTLTVDDADGSVGGTEDDSVLVNDSDPDGDPLTVVLDVSPSNGALTLNSDGTFVYVHDGGETTSDSFIYQVDDGFGGTSTAAVTIDVTPVNDAPVANDDAQSVAEGGTVNVDVVANDTDADGIVNPATVTVKTGPSNGSLVVYTDGTVDYTHDGSEATSDSFTYTVNDNDGTLSNVATVTISIAPVNDAPVAVDDAYSTSEDTPLTVVAPGVLGNDSDVEGDPLTAMLDSSVSHGSLALNADGSFSYTPDPNFNGLDSFSYHAHDGLLDSNIAAVTITVNAVNDAPVAADDVYATDEDVALSVASPGVLSNDTDIDGDSLTAILDSDVSHGSLVLNADGSFRYTPDPNFNGTDSFSYQANDGLLDSNIVTVTITVNTVNDVPVAVDGVYTTDEDTPLAVVAPGVLGNDSNVDGDPLTAVLDGGPTNGSLTLNGDGSFSYTPNANFNGTDSFSYHASDGLLDSNIAAVTITVNTVNDVPVANDDTATTDEDTSVTVDVLANDTDVDGDILVVDSVTQGANGTVTINPDETVTYTPDADFHGSDSFTYTVDDGHGGFDTATVNVTVGIVNDAPMANGDVATTDEDTAVTVDVLANDTDVDGDTLVVDSVTQGANGTVTNNGSDVTYTADADFHGSDSFTYTVDDGHGGFDTATVTVNVTPAGGQIDPCEIFGVIWEDFNNDGEIDFGEKAIENVTVNLSGTDDRGVSVNLTTQTDQDGVYMFYDLRPGDYTISEVQPVGYRDGKDTLGAVNGEPMGDASINDVFSGIVITDPGSVAADYNFGERPLAAGDVGPDQAATIGFWQNNNGQALLKSLNGGEDATQLSSWLAATFPNMYGAGAGANDLTGMTNAEVAEFYKGLFSRKKKENEQLGLGGPTQMDAQVMAVAFACYVTNSTLAGTTATDYGFEISEYGLGIATFNVGTNGQAFGVEDRSDLTVLDLLLRTDRLSANGVFYDLDGDGDADDDIETLLRTMANDVFSAINEQGDI